MVGSEAGYRTLIVRKLYVDVAVFHNHYDRLYGYGDNTVYIEGTPPNLREILQLSPVNVLGGDTNGFEIAPDWKPTSWWQLKGSYSYLHLAVHNQPGLTDPLEGRCLRQWFESTPRDRLAIAVQLAKAIRPRPYLPLRERSAQRNLCRLITRRMFGSVGMPQDRSRSPSLGQNLVRTSSPRVRW